MLALHAHFRPPELPRRDAGLTFWVEQLDAEAWAAPAGRSAKGPRPHPGAGDGDTARAALEALLPAAFLPPVLGDAREQRLLLWLPSDGRAPLPSGFGAAADADRGDGADRLGAPEPGRRPPGPAGVDLHLRQWTVDGLALPPLAALVALAALPPPAQLPAGLRLGADAAFWRLAAGLVLEAVGQEQVLPEVTVLQAAPAGGRRPADPPVLAHWRPVLDGGAQAGRLERLRRGMPPACRAEAPSPAEAPGPGALLDAFLACLTDAALRGFGGHLGGAQLTLPGSPEAWVEGLLGGDGLLAFSPAQADQLSTAHRAWRRSLEAAGQGPFRLALRLQAPETAGEGLLAGMAAAPADSPDEPWRLHFLLQARDDPSLLLPADAVWRAPEVLPAFGRQLREPQALLLTGLHYVGRLCPAVRRTLSGRRPQEARLSTAEAHAFLRETAPLLDQAGFGVLVPPWWQGRESRLGLRLQVSRPAAPPRDGREGGLGLASLVAFRWQLTLGGQPLDEADFAALVALREPLVRLRGQWVQLDPYQMEAALRFLQRGAGRHEQMALGDALGLVLGAEETLDGLPVEDVEAEGELAGWLDRLRSDAALAPLPPPAGLRANLRPYQERGLAWLAFLHHSGLSGILADDMGLGKTLQTLAFLLHLRESGAWREGPVLLVAPTSVVPNWPREAARFSPGLRCLEHLGPQRPGGTDFLAALPTVDLCVTSYGLLRRDRELLTQVAWAGVVLDEAQQLKNPSAQGTRLAQGLKSPWRLALTGTPVENRLTELWSLMQLCLPGYLGPLDRFRRQVAVPVERHGDEQALRRLRRLTGPFILRRLKSDPAVAADLPPKVEMKVYCHLSAEQASLYQAEVDQALRQVEQESGIERSGQVLRMLLRLKQVCNHPAQMLGQLRGVQATEAELARSGKLQRFVELLEEALSEGERILVFTQFAEFGELLRRLIQGRLGVEALYLHGGLPPAARERLLRRFQAPDGPPVFVISLKAGGTGLNLTAASQVIHVDRWWNPAVENQATDRAYRIGQARRVLVHKFVCLGTLEERIDALIAQKEALAEQVVGSGEQWLTGLSTQALRDLVSLRQEALAQ